MDSKYVGNRSQLIVNVPAAARMVLNRLVKGLGPQRDDEGIKDCFIIADTDTTLVHGPNTETGESG